MNQAVHAIREQDPAPLSTINRLYRGDIETIVAKAVEKDKTGRYSSAANRGADIRRYLDDQPIAARLPSAAYQLRKFARLHRALVAGVAAVFVARVASMVEEGQARRAERSAVAAKQTATQERDRAIAGEAAAEQATGKARRRKRQRGRKGIAPCANGSVRIPKRPRPKP